MHHISYGRHSCSDKKLPMPCIRTVQDTNAEHYAWLITVGLLYSTSIHHLLSSPYTRCLELIFLYPQEHRNRGVLNQCYKLLSNCHGFHYCTPQRAKKSMKLFFISTVLMPRSHQQSPWRGRPAISTILSLMQSTKIMYSISTASCLHFFVPFIAIHEVFERSNNVNV